MIAEPSSRPIARISDHPRQPRAAALAAGVGQRMRPAAVAAPKTLVEIGGRALVDRASDRLESSAA